MSVAGKTIVLMSGKGGVGKTTLCASLGLGLALQGHRTAMIDFDIGMRNLDLAAGAERRVLYDFIHVLEGEARLEEALIRDRHCDNLYLLAASQTRDQSALEPQGVQRVIDQLFDAQFEYILCDSPPGIGPAAQMAYRCADEALLCVTPDTASVRAADRVLGFFQQLCTRLRASPATEKLIINRFSTQRQRDGTALDSATIIETLAVELLVEIPDCARVAHAWQVGKPVIADTGSHAGKALQVAAAALTGRTMEWPQLAEKRGLLERLKLR